MRLELGRILSVVAVALSLASVAPVSVADQGNGVEQRVSALEALVASLNSQLALVASRVTTLEALTQPQWNVDVQCGSGQTIANALAQNAAQLGIVVISVYGTCTENVSLARPRTVIRAGAPGAEIVAQNPSQPVVQITTTGLAQGLGLAGLTIRGGSVGVLADNGAQLQLQGVVVTGNQTGVRGEHNSFVRILGGSRVEHNNLGVQANNGAHVLVAGSMLNDNNDFGLQLQFGAIVDVVGSEIARNLGGGGGIRGAVGLYGGAMLRLSNTSIHDNTGNGIFAVDGSSVWLDNGVVIDANGGNGISLSDTTTLGKFFATTGVQVTNNSRVGISCAASPGVAQLYGFPPTGQGITLSGNLLGNNNCPTSPVP